MHFRSAVLAMMLALTGCAEAVLSPAMVMLGVRSGEVLAGPICRPADVSPATLEIEGLNLEPGDYTVTTKLEPVAYQPALMISLNDEAATRFAQLTEDMIGRQIALKIDREVWSEPYINSVITDGNVMITSGTYSMEELEALTLRLTAPCD